MLKTRMRRRSREENSPRSSMADIRASIAALSHDDLLDFAGIFKGNAEGMLCTIAMEEVSRRALTL